MKTTEQLKVTENMLKRVMEMHAHGMTDPFTKNPQPEATDIECFATVYHTLGHQYLPSLERMFPKYLFEHVPTHYLIGIDLKNKYGAGNYLAFPVADGYLVIARKPVFDIDMFAHRNAIQLEKTATPPLLVSDGTQAILRVHNEKTIKFAIQQYIAERGQ